MQNKYKIIIIAVAALLIAGLCFYIGRRSVKITTIVKTEYVQLDPIHDTIPDPVPYNIYIPVDVDTANLVAYCIRSGLYDYLLPTIVRDSIVYVEVDTTKILQDFINEVKYDITLFDIDTVGKTQLKASVQYNRLHSISYDFYPIMKLVTTTNDYTRRFEPFVSAGMGWDKSVRAAAGIFFPNGLGIEGAYRRNFETNQNVGELNVLFKF